MKIKNYILISLIALFLVGCDDSAKQSKEKNKDNVSGADAIFNQLPKENKRIKKSENVYGADAIFNQLPKNNKSVKREP